MRFREYRGNYEQTRIESLFTAIDIKESELERYLRTKLAPMRLEQIETAFFTHDEKMGKDVWLVMALFTGEDHSVPVGFIDKEPVPHEA